MFEYPHVFEVNVDDHPAVYHGANEGKSGADDMRGKQHRPLIKKENTIDRLYNSIFGIYDFAINNNRAYTIVVFYTTFIQ